MQVTAHCGLVATLGSGRTDRHWQWLLAGGGVPRTRPLPAASGGTSTSLPPDAADWFRQATAEATSNTTSVHLFPDQLVLGGVIHPCGIATQCPFQPAKRAQEGLHWKSLLTAGQLTGGYIARPPPSAVPHPTTKARGFSETGIVNWLDTTSLSTAVEQAN